MKRFLIAATAAAGLLAAATTASAAPGDVTVTGTVATSCAALTDSTIGLGTLDDSAGVLDTSKAGSTNIQFRCNVINPSFKLEAQALTNAAHAGAPTGYTGIVGFTATATPTMAGGSSGTALSCTTGHATAAPNVACTDTETLTGYLQSHATGNNMAVAVSSVTSNGGQLIAGNYNGLIRITISPTPF